MATKENEDETGDGNETGFNVNLIDTIANDLQELKAMHNPPPGVIEIMALIGSLLGPPFNTFKPSVSIDDDEKQYYENIKHNVKQMKKHFSSKKILVALKSMPDEITNNSLRVAPETLIYIRSVRAASPSVFDPTSASKISRVGCILCQWINLIMEMYDGK